MLHVECTHVLNPAPLRYLVSLQVLNLRDNYIGDFESVMLFLQSMRCLEKLDMRGNPVEKAPKFHDQCIIHAKRLEWIDNKDVKEQERKYLLSLRLVRENKIMNS